MTLIMSGFGRFRSCPITAARLLEPKLRRHGPQQGGSSKGRGGAQSGDTGKGKGKEEEESENKGRVGCGALELEVLKAADLFQAEGLLRHCLEGFRGALTVQTVVEQLVWAHTCGPAEARAVATEYFIAHFHAVKVRVVMGRTR